MMLYPIIWKLQRLKKVHGVEDMDNYGDDFSCIGYDDMNFYYHGTHKVIYKIMPDNADYIADWNGIQGLTFYDITYRFGYFTGVYDNKGKLFHQLRVLYKTRHLVYDDEYPKPL